MDSSLCIYVKLVGYDIDGDAEDGHLSLIGIWTLVETHHQQRRRGVTCTYSVSSAGSALKVAV